MSVADVTLEHIEAEIVLASEALIPLRRELEETVQNFAITQPQMLHLRARLRRVDDELFGRGRGLVTQELSRQQASLDALDAKRNRLGRALGDGEKRLSSAIEAREQWQRLNP